MVTIIGLKFFTLSYFHLIYHAYFKALLFLTAGSIIHTFIDIQDSRSTGALIKFLPISYLIIIIGFTSLTGLPFTTGFYSKEMILNQSIYTEIAENNFYQYIPDFIYICTILTAFITILYSLKYIIILFFNNTKLSLFQLSHFLHFYSLYLIISLTIISLITIFLGYIFEGWNLLLNFNITYINLFIPLYIKIIPIIFFIISYWTPNILLYTYNNILKLFNYNKLSYSIKFNILKGAYGFKSIYIFISGFFVFLSYRVLFKIFDSGFIDLLISVFGLNIYNISLSNLNSYINNKSISIVDTNFISIILFSIFILLNII